MYEFQNTNVNKVITTGECGPRYGITAEHGRQNAEFLCKYFNLF